jgi:hypothetical protein
MFKILKTTKEARTQSTMEEKNLVGIIWLNNCKFLVHFGDFKLKQKYAK